MFCLQNIMKLGHNKWAAIDMPDKAKPPVRYVCGACTHSKPRHAIGWLIISSTVAAGQVHACLYFAGKSAAGRLE